MDERKLYIIKRSELDRLIRLLREDTFTVIGPTRREHAIVYDEITSTEDLPQGYTDEQQPGRYRLQPENTDQLFDYVVGPQSWKRFLFPPSLKIFGATRDGGANHPFSVDVRRTTPPKLAFFGARSCDLAALAIQDRVFKTEIVDPYYQAVRDQAFVVAVNCTQPGGTCFCSSMGTGPRCARNFDLCLTELDGDFSVEIGSEAGAILFRKLESREAHSAEQRLYQLLLERSAEHMGRALDTDAVPEALARSVESPRWRRIAERCLACANCTMVCPTCFCYSVEDHTDLSGNKAERWRSWGSCFTVEFSYLGAHTVRTEGYSRYRQWLTHKLSSWKEQFGTLGCVGCGRCITWCPVGIDLTEEATAFVRDVAAEAMSEAQDKAKETAL